EESKSVAPEGRAEPVAGDFEFLLDESIQVVNWRARPGAATTTQPMKDRPIRIAGIAIIVCAGRDIERPARCQRTNGPDVDLPGELVPSTHHDAMSLIEEAGCALKDAPEVGIIRIL